MTIKYFKVLLKYIWSTFEILLKYFVSTFNVNIVFMIYLSTKEVLLVLKSSALTKYFPYLCTEFIF